MSATLIPGSPTQRNLPISRISRACEACRARKVRCNGESPCARCRGTNRHCEYRSPRSETRSTRKPLRAHNTPRPGPSGVLPSTAPVRHDPVHFKRQRELRAGIGVSNVDTGSFQYYGPSSHFCFIQRMYQRIQQKTDTSLLTPTNSVPDGVRNWNLERFMFSVGVDSNPSQCPAESYFPRDLGESFIDSYFRIIHPQAPVLLYVDVVKSWNNLWSPPWERRDIKGDEILFMVLAIGARVCSFEGKQNTRSSEGWAHHFVEKAKRLNDAFEDISMASTHFMLLKAIYAFQVMRPNEAYLYLGHAARIAMALGINRLQVVDGVNAKAHRLRLTFWTIYAYERSCALYTGRPSAFRDELNDIPYVEDFPVSDTLEMPPASVTHLKPSTDCGFIRAIAKLAAIADRILVEIYSPTHIPSFPSAIKIHDDIRQYELDLETITHDLPAHLHFFDEDLPLGNSWQEIQRMALGNQFYFTRMLIYRPALVFATFLNSQHKVQGHVTQDPQLCGSIHEAISSAQSIVQLNHDVYFQRYPEARFDGSSASLLVSACVTLLYDVFDPMTTSDNARKIFASVERAIKCLDQINHIGPTSGKALSLDVMKIAKDTLQSTREDSALSDDLLSSFPWLQYGNYAPRENGLDSGPIADTLPQGEEPAVSAYIPNETPAIATSIDAYNSAQVPAPEVHYMSHWLEAGFDPEDIPHCLY
ncbi:hypothetical protein BDV38DRAFT_294355 [Aspergillus pseudotamarii]|uniref:Zn(2)-C6 fungal-type domain-containing protein n=1 Tax=Aspergillus pseudotamarii TaxID=132259 RepID=A0A5N6T826_ASPPS|nr:uncharacterized protein BDV38DRAFT_294355 [Aspergillus pseudotamarii]KAE8142483.1 hypothetical protein BDV38DRAFT_294355 [Aspergillus pseudotamarii]